MTELDYSSEDDDRFSHLNHHLGEIEQKIDKLDQKITRLVRQDADSKRLIRVLEGMSQLYFNRLMEAEDQPPLTEDNI